MLKNSFSGHSYVERTIRLGSHTISPKRRLNTFQVYTSKTKITLPGTKGVVFQDLPSKRMVKNFKAFVIFGGIRTSGQQTWLAQGEI